MARRTEKQNEVYKALGIVMKDAQERLTWLESRKEKEPKHSDYYQRHIQEAKTVIDFCFVRQMQIDPD